MPTSADDQVLPGAGRDHPQRRDEYLPRTRRSGATRSTILVELVVKPVGEAGGYGITIGPRASQAELEDCRAKLLADPANYISQP